MDDGGTADGGADTSATQTFVIIVIPVNDPPVCADGSATTDEDVAVTIRLQASDVDDTVLDYLLVGPPSNGTVTLAGDQATYAPNPNYSGPDSFTFRVADPAGSLSPVCTVRITVRPVGGAPVAVIDISPLADLGPSVPGLNVIASGNGTACVTLDGSQSSSGDDTAPDSLGFVWVVDGVLVAEGAVAEVCLEVGSREITLLVDNGGSIGQSTVVLEVLTAAEATEELVLQVNNSVIERGNKRPFLASLKATIASFDRGNSTSGMNLLGAFQIKVRAQVRKGNPEIAAVWIRIAQEIIDAMKP
jgi:hypothetical protein